MNPDTENMQAVYYHWQLRKWWSVAQSGTMFTKLTPAAPWKGDSLSAYGRMASEAVSKQRAAGATWWFLIIWAVQRAQDYGVSREKTLEKAEVLKISEMRKGLLLIIRKK